MSEEWKGIKFQYIKILYGEIEQKGSVENISAFLISSFDMK